MINKFASEDFSNLLGARGELFLKYLFDSYYEELCKLSFRYIGRTEIAEDLVQEVFINTWNKRYSIQYTGNIKPCLIRSVINISLNYIQSLHARQSFENESKLTDFENIHYTEFEGQELDEILKLAINTLPDKCRTIFVMSRLSSLSHKEISEQLNISSKTVEAQITIALKRIREILKKSGYFSLLLFFLK
jgi:RNA polymerase sigma-70 factor, ECF subfamily